MARAVKASEDRAGKGKTGLTVFRTVPTDLQVRHLSQESLAPIVLYDWRWGTAEEDLVCCESESADTIVVYDWCWRWTEGRPCLFLWPLLLGGRLLLLPFVWGGGVGGGGGGVSFVAVASSTAAAENTTEVNIVHVKL